MRRLISTVTLALAAGVALVGCGTVHAGQSSQTGRAGLGAAQAMTGAPPLDAALVTDRFGWVLTPDRLLVTEDGGVSFREVRLPLAPGSSRAVQFRDRNHGTAVSGELGAITVARTSDGGRTWTTKRIRETATASPVEFGRMQVAFGDSSDGMIMARWVTSSAFSEGTVFTTTNAGRSWQARRAPAGGQVAVEPGGRSWLAGGVVGDRLYRSDDLGGHWSRARLDLADAVDSATVSVPVGGALPVTVVNGGKTQVALLRSADGGRSWQETGRTAVRGLTSAGVAVPVAATTTGALVIDTAGGHAYRATGPAVADGGADLRPSGLPEGVYQARFATGLAGWALSTRGQCTNGKQNCALVHTLLGTTDGGVSWRPLLRWDEPLN
ncbi:MAG TPA: hypothetical protein VKE25_00560 [Actinomycetes bacterium]|nr:hypothetical protein [Actinomycetes bacterium]